MTKLAAYVCIISIISLMSCAISKKENERIDKLIYADQQLAMPDYTDTVNADVLASFEDRAIQKLEDFYDYLNLLGNQQYDEVVKYEIRKSALDLFYDGKIPSNLLNTSGYDSSRSISQFLNVLGKEIQINEVEIDEIAIEQPLTMQSSNCYEGKLSFSIAESTASDTLKVNKKVNFSLRKVDNRHSSSPKEVWLVFLDSIY